MQKKLIWAVTIPAVAAVPVVWWDIYCAATSIQSAEDLKKAMVQNTSWPIFLCLVWFCALGFVWILIASIRERVAKKSAPKIDLESLGPISRIEGVPIFSVLRAWAIDVHDGIEKDRALLNHAFQCTPNQNMKLRIAFHPEPISSAQIDAVKAGALANVSLLLSHLRRANAQIEAYIENPSASGLHGLQKVTKQEIVHEIDRLTANPELPAGDGKSA